MSTPSAPAALISSGRGGLPSSAQSSSCAQSMDAPEDCIVAVGTNIPGTTWSKVKVRRCSSGSGDAEANEIHELVPRHTYGAVSGFTRPAPTAAVGPSPPPMTTRTPCGRPIFSATSSRIAPTTWVDSRIGGNSDSSAPAASRISEDQVPADWSYALVEEASERSVARTPVSRCTTKSLARHT